MNDIEDEERAKRIASAFALLTAKLEDATALTADGQSRRTNAEFGTLAGQIADLNEEVTTIAAVLGAILPDDH